MYFIANWYILVYYTCTACAEDQNETIRMLYGHEFDLLGNKVDMYSQIEA